MPLRTDWNMDFLRPAKQSYYLHMLNLRGLLQMLLFLTRPITTRSSPPSDQSCCNADQHYLLPFTYPTRGQSVHMHVILADKASTKKFDTRRKKQRRNASEYQHSRIMQQHKELLCMKQNSKFVNVATGVQGTCKNSFSFFIYQYTR